MTLSTKQAIFALNITQLIQAARRMGYAVTFGEAYRPPETAALYASQGRGIANSLHTKRLAVDLNVFKDGAYLPTSAALKPLGDCWKTIHPDNRWGGDFSKPDGNHFSMEHEGVK